MKIFELVETVMWFQYLHEATRRQSEKKAYVSAVPYSLSYITAEWNQKNSCKLNYN